MHLMSPGVERAVVAARAWAEKLGSAQPRLNHYVLALLEEEEGRPAMLLEKAGVALSAIRDWLLSYHEAPIAPPVETLFQAARQWSLTYRHDPEFLTDALLIVVLRCNPQFNQATSQQGVRDAQLQKLLTPNSRAADELLPDSAEQTLAVFSPPDPAGLHDAARIVDTNLNRAREACRVLEDYCRFALNDRHLTGECKELRHELATVTRLLPTAELISSRDTQGDVGTNISGAGEYQRDSPGEVVLANSKRLQEALRSLEEFGKIFAPQVGRAFETIRYRAYVLEKALSVRFEHHPLLAALGRSRLYMLLTGAQCQASLDWTIEQAARGGVQIVQLREKAVSDRQLLTRARDVRKWTRKAGLLYIVNDRPDVARLCEADGVHLGQDDLSVQDARRILGGDKIIGVSTHSLEQVRRAVLDGADYLGVGPVFSSSTKDFPALAGLDFVAAAAAETSLPSFALGGIGVENIHKVIDAGGRRVAVSAAIATAEDPEMVSRQLRESLDAAWESGNS